MDLDPDFGSRQKFISSISWTTSCRFSPMQRSILSMTYVIAPKDVNDLLNRRFSEDAFCRLHFDGCKKRNISNDRPLLSRDASGSKKSGFEWARVVGSRVRA